MERGKIICSSFIAHHKKYDGFNFYCGDNRLFPVVFGLFERLRKLERKQTMNLESIIGLLTVVLLMIYLGYALLRPEKF